MNMNKLIGISLSIFCIGGSMIGFQSQAGSWFSRMLPQSSSEAGISTEKLEKMYNEFYSYLLRKGSLSNSDARSQAMIFKKEVKEGKSLVYAQYYSMLIAVCKMRVTRARYQSEIFEKKFETTKNFAYSDYYANIITTNNIKHVVQIEDVFKTVGEMHDIGFSKEAHELATIIKEKKGPFSYLLSLSKYSKNIMRNINTVFAGLSNMDETMTNLLDEEVSVGRSVNYALRYVNALLGEGLEEHIARKQAEIVENEMSQGKEYSYSVEYAKLISKGDPEDEARRNARTIARKEQIRGSFFAVAYAEMMKNGLQPEEALYIAEIADLEGKSGKTYQYAMRYAELIFKGETEEKARAEAKKYC